VPLIRPATIFRDRTDAADALGRAVARVLSRREAIVFGLPRGGVPVALGISRTIGAPLDVFLVRKLGTPGHEELAFGAIASGDIRVLNHDVIEGWQIEPDVIEEVAGEERAELERRERIYRAGRSPLPVNERLAILVDDGLATGATMLAAIRAVRLLNPSGVMVAVPVAAREALENVRRAADEVVCLETPEPFCAVGAWYRRFDQVSDAEVCRILVTESRASFSGRQHPTRL
jgi:putative phosphoribosyl transferase